MKKNMKKIEKQLSLHLARYAGKNLALPGEENLKGNAQLYRSLIETSPDAIMLIDKDLKIIMVNRQAVRLHGFDNAHELIGKNALDIIAANDRRRAISNAFKITKYGTRKNIVYTFLRKDGSSFFGELNVSVTRDKLKMTNVFIGIVRDITEHRKADYVLKLSEEHYRATLDSMADAIHVIDSSMRIILFNQTFIKLNKNLKLNSKVIGKNLFDVFPSLSDKARSEYKKVFKTAKPVVTSESHTIKGREINLEVRKIPILEQGIAVRVLTVITDVSQRKLLEKEFEKVHREILESNMKLKELAMLDSHTGLYNHRYLEDILEKEFLRAKRYKYHISLIMLDIDYFKSINDVYGHQFGDLVLRQFATQIRKVVRKYDIVTRFGGEEFVIVSPGTNTQTALSLAERISSSINLCNFGDKRHHVKIKLSMSIVSYPENDAATGMGLLNVADKVLNRVKEEGGDRVYAYSDISKHGRIDNVAQGEDIDVNVIKDKMDKLTKRANQSLVEAIFAFAKTIELKDHYTGEHVERTVEYATGLCHALNLSKEDTNVIKQAAILHDLGKIGISDKILLKKSKLTKNEFEEIKKHPQIAADIIRPIQFLHNIVPLVFHHHERWDGKGYPSGLKGEHIPIGARIISIADAYQALISDRAYRKAYSKKEAIKILREESGTRYDPAILDMFLNVI